MANEGLRPSTITTTLSAISYAHKYANLPDATHDFAVRKLLQALSRSRKTQDSRLPILPSTLYRLTSVVEDITHGEYSIRLFKAAFLIMFFAFLRVGEIAVSNYAEAGKVLQFHNVTFFGKSNHITSVTLKLTSFKHDKAKPITIKVHSRPGPFCPVKHLYSFAVVRGEAQGPFFITKRGLPLTTYNFSKVFKQAILRLGLDADLFKPHSFRIGAATYCAQQGIPEHVIMSLGRWSSQAFKKYIRCPTFTRPM